MKRLIIALALGLCATFINSAASTHAAVLRTVALSGQQVPGAPDGTVFGDSGPFFNPPVLNDAGQTAFLHGKVWSEGSGSLALAAAQGQQAPGMPDGVTFATFSDDYRRIVINDAGLTAFSATTSLSNSIYGIWSSGPDGATLVALSNNQAAGAPPGVFYNLETLGERDFLLNEAGQVAFRSYLIGGGEGIWAQRHGNVELVARNGSHAAGTPDGVNFRDFTTGGPVFNRLGRTAFVGALTGSGVDSTNDSGIWSEGSGSLELVAREGSQAPGMPDGVVFVAVNIGPPAFTTPALNKAGQTAFVSRVTGGGLTAASGIWMGTAGNLSLVASRGDQAPGTSSGVNFSTLARPTLNDAGQLAFFSTLTGTGVDSTNNFGLWSGAPGSLALVARTGEHAPGTEDAVVFRALSTPNSGTSPLVLNAAGQSAFVAQLTGSGITTSNDFGIWATDSHGALKLIAREGKPLEVAPGDVRTVSNLVFLRDQATFSTGNNDGQPSAFNNRGQLAFLAAFTDGSSGIFVSNRVAVPEPGTLLLAALAALGLLLRRQRQLCAAIIGVALYFAAAQNAQAVTVRTVALSGQQAPGAPDGTAFTSFFRPIVLNDAGQTAFVAFSSDLKNGIWSEGGGSLHLAAAVGQPAPGLPDGVNFTSTGGRIVINDAGSTAFVMNSFEPGVDIGSHVGLWSSASGSSTLIARHGAQAAGTPAGATYILDDIGPRSLLFNDAGQAAFAAQLRGVDLSINQGIWAQRNGNLELVALGGNQAPGTPAGVSFSSIDFRFGFNKFGHTAFYSMLAGPGIDSSTNGFGIWSDASGSLSLVARLGSQAPGMPVGAVFTAVSSNFDILALNASGRMAFAGAVTGGGVDANSNNGIWSDASGSLELVVRSGTPAPGTPSGVNFAGLGGQTPALNDAGQIAFFGSLTGTGVVSTNNRGLWSGDPDSLALVARKGENAPGTEDGVVFSDFISISGGPVGARTLILNSAGQTAFSAVLSGGGVSASNNFGIWATDRSGTLQLIAREGDLLEVAPAVFRTINTLTFLGDPNSFSTGNSDGSPSPFNNLGQLAFGATFTDGSSGIFVSNRVAVPEPSSLLLVAFAVPAVVVVRGRGRKNPNSCPQRPAPRIAYCVARSDNT